MFVENEYDVLAWNYRGCSGEMNRQKRFYHSGATDDLSWVINHAAPNYESIYLIGFSLGGNLTLILCKSGGAKGGKMNCFEHIIPLEQ